MILKFGRAWLLSFAVLCGVLGGTNVWAAESGISLTVTAFDVREDDTVEIGFDVENRSSAKTDVLYRLEVVAKDPAGRLGATDETEYKTLSVAPQGVTRERFSYTAPMYVGGEFELYLSAMNPTAAPLAGALVGTTSFTSVPIPVTLGDCRLLEGTAIAPTSKPQLVCKLKNTSDKEQVMILSGDLSHWGEALVDRPLASTEVTLAPGKDNLVSLDFPPLSESGMYVGRVYLGNTISHLSPYQKFFVIVSGTSAHISQITLDKDRYTTGESAVVTVTADILYDQPAEEKKLMVTAMLQDGTGSSCAAPMTQDFGGGEGTLTLSVQARCTDPRVELKITDKEGKVFDQGILQLTSAKRSFFTGKAIAALLVGMIFLAALTVYLVSRQRRTMRPRSAALTLVFMIALGGLMAADTASASTWWGSVWLDTDNWDWVGTGTGITMHLGCASCTRGSLSVTSGPIRVNGGVSMPTDNFRISTNSNQIDFYTGNSFNYAGSLFVTGGTVSGSATCNTDGWSITGSGNSIIISCNGPGGVLTFTDTPPPVCVNGVGPYTAPQPYDNAWCQARGYDVSTNTCVAGSCICSAPRVWNGTACAPPVAVVNGKCGPNSANPPYDPNRALGSNPSVFLCDTGTPTAVPVLPNLITVYPATGVLSPAWQWTCLGSGGGANATCWVFQAAAATPVTTFTGSYAGPPAQTNVSTLNLPAGGGNITLNWSVSNAAGGSCTGYSTTNLPGWANSGTAKPISGVNVPVTIVGTTRFDLDCRNASGTNAVRRSVQVNVASIFTYHYCPPSVNLNVGATSQLRLFRRADANPVNCADPFANPGTIELTSLGTTVWTSDNAGIAAVDNAAAKGRITAIAGSATAANVSAVDNGASTGLSVPVTVNFGPPPTYAICPAGSLALHTVTNPTVQLRLWQRTDGTSVNCASLSGSTEITADAATDWSSNNGGVATVNNAAAKGLVTAIGGGSATISARVSGVLVDSVTVTSVSCIPYNCGTLPGSVTEQHCPGESFTTGNNCSGTISCTTGTRTCDFNWKEVQQ